MTLTPKFTHHDLRIVQPRWDDDLVTTIIELEKLRVSPLGGEVHPLVFFQLKEIFQLLESLESARIEGNRTTLLEAVEQQINGSGSSTEQFTELTNIRAAMSFIERNTDSDTKIDRAYIQEIHKIVVEGLIREGDPTPGRYRTKPVKIVDAPHLPPPPTKVNDYMDELLGFVNESREKKYELLSTAIAHHRFAWVHPFGNGNGRVVRLLTYAMLIKQGFTVNPGRIINPASVFFANRELYYGQLSGADLGTDEGILSWCRYMLAGLLRETVKIDNLLDPNYLASIILLPAIYECQDNKIVTAEEAEILTLAAKKMPLSSSDIVDIVGPSPLQRSRAIAKLRAKKMLGPITDNGRQYVITFSNNYLLRGVIKTLQGNGFISEEHGSTLTAGKTELVGDLQ